MKDSPITDAFLPMTGRVTTGEAITCVSQALDSAGLEFAHGTDNARDESAWLIAFAMGRSPVQPPDADHVLTESERSSIERVIARRITERVPAAYITGRTWFAGHEMLCDERALVPRSPLAEFITSDFYGLLDTVDSPRVLDLCTGGGCIAIASALARPDAIVHASDLSADALALAADNVALHGLQDRVHLLHGSLFDPVDARYDLIISNPPYVDAADIRAMAPEFHREPEMGLGAGDDGLDIVTPMLAEAPDYLTDEGWIVVEVGNSAEAVERRWPTLELAWLEFASGGDGVFAVQRRDLLALRPGQ